ncbi:MAG: glycosyl hydrolase, partial [Bacteroidota bacterium]
MRKSYPIHLGLLLVISSGFLSMVQAVDGRYSTIKTVDPKATKATKALYANLKKLAKTKLLFGHQDALAYGVTWEDWHKHRSDVEDVCGQHPAVVGWDLGKLGDSPHNLDTVDFEHMKAWIKKVYKMGGINTISWHMDNFYGGSTWDVGNKVVAALLPGGEKHAAYLAKLDHFANFVRDLRVGFIFKKKIPIIFRPFHEHTGSWFWWGKGHCSPEEYKALWRFTVEYLRDEKGLHHILWAYSPDIFNDKAHYLECYPGDEYVDILGLDDYHDMGANGHPEDLTKRLRMVVELAQEKDKVAALTETGLESIPQANWWTDTLLRSIQADPVAA